MLILRFLFRKMWKNRWLTLSTWIGLVVAVSFTISIPMYSDGSLKRVVAATLASKSSGLPAASLLMKYQAVGSQIADGQSLEGINQFIEEDLPASIDFPDDAYVSSMSIRGVQVVPENPQENASKVRQMELTTHSGITKDQIEIVDGVMYADTIPPNGIIEAIIHEETLSRNDMHIGEVYKYKISGVAGISFLNIKITGAYKPKKAEDLTWYQGVESLYSALMISGNVFTKGLLQQKKIPLGTANWFYAFDLTEIKTSQLSSLSSALSRLDTNLSQKLENTKVEVTFLPMLGEFKAQSLQMQLLLFALAAPMLAMVFYYIAMNSRQALDRQRVDIAVIRSRGSSTRQIIWLYLLEGLVLGGSALLIGPLMGWFLAKSIGSASGFLTFVGRKSLDVGLGYDAVLYGIIAVVIAIATTVLPAVFFARTSIVGYKQQLARADRNPLWQRWYWDIILIAACGYGWYLFNQKNVLSLNSGLSSDQLQVHPLLFFVPAVAIFALGLFFLRIFPWLLMLINWAGKSFIPMPIYLTLTQLSRSAKTYYPLMLLLTLTLGLGVYNSSAARTIDLNSTDRTLYQYGTDVAVQSIWDGYTEDADGDGEEGVGATGEEAATIVYSEPPFEIYRHLEGIEAAARVMQTAAKVSVTGKSVGQGTLMGIDNIDFSKAAWFRADLFPADPSQYLNLLGSYEQAVLISTEFADKNGVKSGDVISMTVQKAAIDFVVVGILPYWPSQYPRQSPFFIANLDYIYDQAPLIPYEVWMKMEDGAKVMPIVSTLAENGIELAYVKDVRNELITQKNQPSRGGVFGILSLGFLVSALISLIGYILFWFFTLSSRIVQFGVLRAMGLSKQQLTGMLLLEQVFTAGLSIALGIMIGKLISYVFLPFLQTTENAATQVPPFRVVFDSQDTLQLYMVVAVMMLTGAGLLFMQVRRLRVHQAVKLGEER